MTSTNVVPTTGARGGTLPLPRATRTHGPGPTADNPRLLERFNAQHGCLKNSVAGAFGADSEGDVVRVGDRVALGILHPCTTFYKWRAIPTVDDDYAVTAAVRTYF